MNEKIKILAIKVKAICDKYNIPTTINLEKYEEEK